MDICNTILDQFRKDTDVIAPVGMTPEELWREVSRRDIENRIGSKLTLLKYLSRLVDLGLIIKVITKEGPNNRPKYRSKYILSESARLWWTTPNLRWEGKTIEDKDAFIKLLEFQFTAILAQYMELLEDLVGRSVDIEKLARERVAFFFKLLSIESHLTFFAIDVWRKRDNVGKVLSEIEKNGPFSVKLEQSPDALSDLDL